MASFLNLLLVIATTIYIALMYDNEAIMLLVYMEVAFFVMSFISLLIRRRKIKARLEIPVGIAENGGEGLVKITVTNKGKTPLARMKVLLVVKDTARGKKKKQWLKLPAIPCGESEYVRSVLFYGTGKYIVVLRKIRFYDMTGLLHGNIRTESTAQVQVMPQLHDVPVQVTQATKNFYGESDVYDEHSPGYDNNELFQIRSYQKGDRVQSIHWKLTAKQEEIMVKDRALPKVCPVILFLNFHPVGVGKRTLRQLAFIDAVSSISYSFVEAGCPHYVAWYDEQKMDVVRIRVDDEESLFYFVGTLVKIKWIKTGEELMQRYADKYKSEPYVWAFSLNEKLQFRKGDDLVTNLSEKQLEKTLSQIELML